MCLAKAYIVRGADKEVLMEEVASIEYKEEELVLIPLFGEKKSIRAKIKEVDFFNSTIFIKEKDSEEDQK